ncbi:MAG: pantoate--beta-alanine ligase [Elusimicrobia bacterium]|nr:pantoate--beta-alanine ligase [Elusimicrobiota bacterium]
MLIAKKIIDLQNFLKNKRAHHSLGFVPTMGDLHEGHLSLVKRSKKENIFTAVSIFVNPKQFDCKEDFKKYKRNESKDIEKLRKENVDLVFLPSAQEIYPKGFQTSVEVGGLTKNLCGTFRPGHFKGVAAIVLKLFNLVQPDKAYFGLKDVQQVKVVEQMVKDLNLPIHVIPCPIVREQNGLALSSRNSRLSSEEYFRATKIFFSLRVCADLLKSRRNLSLKFVREYFRNHLELQGRDKVEYFEAVDPETLVFLKKLKPPILFAAAVWIGKTRLIDNVLVLKPHHVYGG